jgi:hypothetical protein
MFQKDIGPYMRIHSTHKMMNGNISESIIERFDK